VIYRDTRGVWDQLFVYRTGHFAGFSVLNARLSLRARQADPPLKLKNRVFNTHPAKHRLHPQPSE
jgi:hypothetical protein